MPIYGISTDLTELIRSVTIAFHITIDLNGPKRNGKKGPNREGGGERGDKGVPNIALPCHSSLLDFVVAVASHLL